MRARSGGRRTTRDLPALVRAALPARGRADLDTAAAAARRFGTLAAAHDVDLDTALRVLRWRMRRRRGPWRSTAVLAAVAEGWVAVRLDAPDGGLQRLQRRALDEWTRQRADGTDLNSALVVLVVACSPPLDAAGLLEVVRSSCRSGESVAALGSRVLVLTEPGDPSERLAARVAAAARAAGARVALETWPVSAVLLLDPARIEPCSVPHAAVSRSGVPRRGGGTTRSWP